MSSIAVIYFSKTGNTEAMAEAVRAGVEEYEGDVEVELASVAEFNPADLTKYEGIIFGSPTYYGIVAAPMKEFLDESIRVHGDLSGKVGAAFASCGIEGGGSETTCLTLIKAMMVHGMTVKGFHDIGHYGPVSVGEPDADKKEECRQVGREIASIVAGD